MLVLVTLCIQFLGLRASRVSNLAGTVDLRMAFMGNCSGRYFFCPSPNLSDNTSLISTEIERMSCRWSQNKSYSFTYTERMANGRYRDFIGSESTCIKSDQGIYSCRTSPAHFCYVKVLLAFQVYSSPKASVQFGDKIITDSYTGHRQTVQVAMFGSRPNYRNMPFNIACLDGEECLDDEVKVISLQYTCL